MSGDILFFGGGAAHAENSRYITLEGKLTQFGCLLFIDGLNAVAFQYMGKELEDSEKAQNGCVRVVIIGRKGYGMTDRSRHQGSPRIL